MTGRTVAEWIGKTPDAAIPTRVKDRVFQRAGERCQGCGRKLAPGDRWDADHIRALTLGGEHRESNLQCLCEWCHKPKTAQDMAIKSAAYRKRAKHIGAKPKAKRPMPGSRNSPWKAKIGGGWERRQP